MSHTHGQIVPLGEYCCSFVLLVSHQVHQAFDKWKDPQRTTPDSKQAAEILKYRNIDIFAHKLQAALEIF